VRSTLIDRLFGIDLRSLALFRVALAGTLLADLFIRAQDLTAHYTDLGVLPRAALLQRFASRWSISLHLAGGTTVIEAALFILAGLLALALLVGWRTRLAAVLSWVLLISLHVRNPIILQGSDTLLRMLLFWSLFLPLAARYSVDHALDPAEPTPPKRVTGVASAALLLQTALMYAFSGALKTGATWHNGTAIAQALNVDHFTTPLGRAVLQWPQLLRPLTHVVLWLERLGPWLLFSPWGPPWLRPVVLLALASLQVGFWLFMELGLFPWVSIVALLPFVSSEWWDALRARLSHPRWAGLRIYYDRDCGFCRKSVRLIREFLLMPEVPLLPAQGDPAVHPLMEGARSWVVIDHDGRTHLRFAAMLAILRASPLAWWLAPVLGWKPLAALGSKAYRAVANHRPIAATLLRPLKFRRQGPARISPRANVTAGLALAYVVWWNLTTLPGRPIEMPPPWSHIGPLLQISQKWNMFAPVPMTSDGWYVIPGKLRDGQEVDLMRGGGPVSWDKPPVVSGMYPNYRWRKYLVNLHKKTYKAHRPLFAAYVCRTWNALSPADRRVEQLELIYMREDTPPEGPPGPAEKIVLLTYTCGSDGR
jgi:predicted DCC family thiol-disulfide oxidoreductase YuxK